MKPPSGLGCEGRAAWRNGERVLAAMAEDVGLAIGTLTRYARVNDTRALAEERFVEL